MAGAGRRGPGTDRAGEAVLVVSGHASPAVGLLRADIPRTRPPDIDILDVNAVLGFDTGAELDQALAGKSGAWLVSWQDAVVDPAGFVPYYLDDPQVRNNRSGGISGIWGCGTGCCVPARPSPRWRPDAPPDANFGHKLALLGSDDPHGRTTPGLLARTEHTATGLPGLAYPGGPAGP